MYFAAECELFSGSHLGTQLEEGAEQQGWPGLGPQEGRQQVERDWAAADLERAMAQACVLVETGGQSQPRAAADRQLPLSVLVKYHLQVQRQLCVSHCNYYDEEAVP